MTHIPRLFPLAFLFALLIILPVGCSSNDVINSLELAINGVSIVVDLAGPSAGLPPDVGAQIKNYAAATATALAQSSDILAGPGTDAQKGAAIAAAFAGIAIPVVPPKYQGIAAAVQQVAVLVAKFLAQAPSPHAAVAGVPSQFSAAFVDSDRKKSTKITKGQRKKLAELKAKAAAAAEAAKKK